MEKASEKLLIKYARALDDSKKIIRTLDSEKGYGLCYLLYHPIADFFVANGTNPFGEDMFEFDPDNPKQTFKEISEWSFDIQEDFLQRLSNGYQIAYITENTLYGVLCLISEYDYEDIQEKDGLTNLVEFCRTLETIDEKTLEIINLLENEILNIEVEGIEEDAEME